MRNFQNFELILQDAHEQPVPNRAAEAGGLQGARFLHPLLHLLEHGQALGRPQTPAISEVHGATYAYETTLPNAGPSGPGRLALQFNIGG